MAKYSNLNYLAEMLDKKWLKLPYSYGTHWQNITKMALHSTIQAAHSTVTKKMSKKMTNFLVKNGKKIKIMPQKMPKKHYESQVENK